MGIRQPDDAGRGGAHLEGRNCRRRALNTLSGGGVVAGSVTPERKTHYYPLSRAADTPAKAVGGPRSNKSRHCRSTLNHGSEGFVQAD